MIKDASKLLKEKISSGDFRGLFVLTGEEDFARKAATNAFINHFKENPLFEFNLHIFSGKETPAETIYAATQALPVMSDEKLVVIKNSGIFKNSTDSQKKLFSDLFENMPDYLSIIFDEDETDGRSALLKSAKSVGLFVDFKFKSPAELVSFASKQFAKEGISASAEVLNHLVLSCDDGMTSLVSEIEKLIAYVQDKKVLTTGDIDIIVKKSLKSRVFEMLDAMIEKKADKVYLMLDEMKACHELPVKILVLIGRQASMLAKTKILVLSGAKDVAGKLGLKPFIAQKYISQASKMTEIQTQNLLKKCVDTDYSIKSGAENDWQAVELLIADITSGNY